MPNRRFDTVVKRSASLMDRRASFALLGGVALGAVGCPGAVGAGKSGKQARKTCRRQRGPCGAFARENCEEGDQACIAARTRCCDHLARCRFAAFVECFNGGDADANLNALAIGRHD